MSAPLGQSHNAFTSVNALPYFAAYPSVGGGAFGNWGPVGRGARPASTIAGSDTLADNLVGTLKSLASSVTLNELVIILLPPFHGKDRAPTSSTSITHSPAFISIANINAGGLSGHNQLTTQKLKHAGFPVGAGLAVISKSEPAVLAVTRYVLPEFVSQPPAMDNVGPSVVSS